MKNSSRWHLFWIIIHLFDFPLRVPRCLSIYLALARISIRSRIKRLPLTHTHTHTELRKSVREIPTNKNHNNNNAAGGGKMLLSIGNFVLKHSAFMFALECELCAVCIRIRTFNTNRPTIRKTICSNEAHLWLRRSYLKCVILASSPV